jgi:hypothetical protein
MMTVIWFVTGVTDSRETALPWMEAITNVKYTINQRYRREPDELSCARTGVRAVDAVEKITARLMGTATPTGAASPAVSSTPPTDVSGTEGTEVSGTDGTDTPGTDGTEVSGADGTEVSGTDGMDVSGADGTDVPGADGTPATATEMPMGAAEENEAKAMVASRERVLKEGIVVSKDRGGWWEDERVFFWFSRGEMTRNQRGGALLAEGFYMFRYYCQK